MKNTQTGAARTWGIAAAILVALAVWMISGRFGGSRPPATDEAGSVDATAKPADFKVAVRTQTAERVQREVVINGDTLPDQIINIASQAEGQVVVVGARKGARVKKGELLARIDPRDTEQRRVRAEAVLHQRELEYQAAQKMRDTGYVTEADLASRRAALEVARADVKDIELRLQNLNITAPAAGVLEDQKIEVGDYVTIGKPVAQLIRIDPLRVSGGVSENDIRYIRPGSPAGAEILGGAKLMGRVKFVSALADPKTRTFTVEVAVDNPGGRIPAGLSARVSLPVQEISAQRIPTSLLSLADDGAVGIKHVVDGKVRFAKAEIVRADGEAVWITGLPDTIQLITRGQGFVAAGETVVTEPEKTAQAETGASAPRAN